MLSKGLHINKKSKILFFSSILMSVLFIQCEKSLKEEVEIENFEIEALSKPSIEPGIPLYTCDMAKDRLTEVNSEWVIRKSSSVNVESEILRNKYNAIHKINFENLRSEDDYFEFVLAIHGKMIDRRVIPSEFTKDLMGVSFRAVSYDQQTKITLEARDINSQTLKREDFVLSTGVMDTFNMSFTSKEIHHIILRVEGSNGENQRKGAIAIDDIYLKNAQNTAFTPPTSTENLLEWLSETSIRYFLWNYVDLGGNQGVVLEANDYKNIVSLSGLGYAYAIYLLAEEKGIIDQETARNRILGMLNWQKSQNWFNGSQGKYGFPYHYYTKEGNGLYPNSPESVSTIDWAMCAAGIRTIKQKYKADNEISSICTELLERPQWENMIHDQVNDTYRFGRITKGINGLSGQKNGQVWGDAFTEESELIYLEALASGKVNDLDLGRIFREQKNGYYVSWFGSGFTYNWMQLWTGLQEPYQTNSLQAYQVDASTSLTKFRIPVMGLTACSTISETFENGFINWKNYLGNQGGSISGANVEEVVQLSPAPYGAILALPFDSNLAVSAIQEYINIGYYHPLLGLPDNIRLSELPNTINVPVPNWTTFDINIGPIAMAIDQYQDKIIASYYMNDSSITNSFNSLKNSF